MNKYLKILTGSILTVTFLSTSYSALAEEKLTRKINTNNFTIEKISNSTSIEGEADGLTTPADRSNSYSWTMEELDNYIYIGSNRDLIYQSVLKLSKNEALSKQLINSIFKGDINTENTDFAPSIFRYDKSSNSIEEVYKSQIAEDGSPYEIGYRGVLKFKDSADSDESLYFGGYGNTYTRILKIKKDFNPTTDTPEVVFSANSGSTSLRGMAELNGKMYVGSTIADTDMRILESSSPSQDNWNVVATWDDFKKLPNIDAKSTAFGGITGITSYNNSLYVFVGSGIEDSEKDAGFLMFKGTNVGINSDGANDAGWKWETIVGPGGKYPAGLGISYFVGGGGFKTSVAGKDYVYVGTASNTMEGLLDAVNFDFSYIYNSLQKGSQLYRFDENDNWEMVIGTPSEGEPFDNSLGNLKAGFEETNDYSANQYLWQMESYNDKLFVSTYDAETLYDYLIPKLPSSETIPNGLSSYNLDSNSISMPSYEELYANLQVVVNYINMYFPEANLNADTIMLLISQFAENPDPKVIVSKLIDSLIASGKTPSEAIDALRAIIEKLNKEEVITKAAPLLKLLNIDPASLPSLDLSKWDAIFTDEVKASLDAIIADNPMPEDGTIDEYLQLIKEELIKILGEDTVNQIIATLTGLKDYVEQLKAIIAKIQEMLTSDNIQKQIFYITEIQKMFDENNAGSSILESSDGINFNTINKDGFEDKFNYGIRTMYPSKEGLLIGTANPFYGTQLWKLNEKSTKLSNIILNDGSIAIPFDKNKLDYSINVDYSVDTLNIYAEAEDYSSTATYTKNTPLSIGENIIKIKVTNSDNINQEYTLKVTRSADTDNNNNNDDNNNNDNDNKDTLPQTGSTSWLISILFAILITSLGIFNLKKAKI